jgi:hypothetical protein
MAKRLDDEDRPPQDRPPEERRLEDRHPELEAA